MCRYTECRLQRLAEDMLLKDLDPDIVDFADNFDGSCQEPTVLPARVPQLLVNGSQGIAVGIATKIPPHNLREVVEALQAFLSDPAISDGDLQDIVRGPDFPTGATLLSTAGIESTYQTGKGSMTMRSKVLCPLLFRSQLSFTCAGWGSSVWFHHMLCTAICTFMGIWFCVCRYMWKLVGCMEPKA